MASIPCCIVDDHCDIVPFIHSCYRAKILQSNILPPIVYHFDSHSDMSIPNSSVMDWMDKENLYEILSSEGGISEFLLPLVYTQCIGKIHWIRPIWCKDDMSIDGTYEFIVGDGPDHLAKASFPSIYYFDDGVYCPHIEMIEKSKKRCSFAITTTTTTTNNDINWSCPLNMSLENESHAWILDICLDYFSVANPFLQRLRDCIGNDFHIEKDGDKCLEYCNTIVETYRQLSYRNQRDGDDPNPTFEETKHHSQLCLDSITSLILKSNCSCNRSCTTNSNCDSVDHWETDRIEKQRVCFGKNEKLCTEFITLISKLSIDTKRFIVAHGTLFLLPHHISSEEGIDTSIKEFGRIVKGISPYSPKAITIAVSSSDEYTPNIHMNRIKSKVIDTIENGLLSFWNQHVDKKICLEIFDLSESNDVVLDTYSLFLHQKCKDYIDS